MNPTASFKDRGMTMAISKAASRARGHLRVHRQRLGVRGGLRDPGRDDLAVLVPDGKFAMGKGGPAIAHGATLFQVDGNFDGCLDGAQARRGYPVELVTR